MKTFMTIVRGVLVLGVFSFLVCLMYLLVSITVRDSHDLLRWELYWLVGSVEAMPILGNVGEFRIAAKIDKLTREATEL